MKLLHLDPCGSPTVDKEQSHMIKKIIDLTLDILYLLTGEDYIVLKMSCGQVTHSSSPCVSGGFGRAAAPPTVPSPSSMKSDSSKKILQLTSRIIELLTRQEEKKSGEEQNGPSEVLKEEVDGTILSEDDSRNGNTAERCPRPLSSWNGGKEGPDHVNQKDQSQNTVVCIKKEKAKGAEQKKKTRRKGRPKKRSPERSFSPQSLLGSSGDLHVLAQDLQDVNDAVMVAKNDPQKKEKDLYAGTRWLHPSIPEERDAAEENEASSHKDPEWEISVDGSLHNIAPDVPGLEDVRPSAPKEAQENPEGTHHRAKKKTFTCQVCGRCFENSGQLESHRKQVHMGEMLFYCTACGISFTSSLDLREHLKVHTAQRLYACSQCSKCFTIKANLMAHRRVHMGDKPFTCAECGRRFALKSSLEAHLPIHAIEKPYPCSHCGKCFTSRIRLASHQTTHTGDKMYGCEDCGKTFTTSGSLNRHRRTHTGEKPYACIVCGKCFNRETNLYRHQMIHTR